MGKLQRNGRLTAGWRAKMRPAAREDERGDGPILLPVQVRPLRSEVMGQKRTLVAGPQLAEFPEFRSPRRPDRRTRQGSDRRGPE